MRLFRTQQIDANRFKPLTIQYDDGPSEVKYKNQTNQARELIRAVAALGETDAYTYNNDAELTRTCKAGNIDMTRLSLARNYASLERDGQLIGIATLSDKAIYVKAGTELMAGTPQASRFHRAWKSAVEKYGLRSGLPYITEGVYSGEPGFVPVFVDLAADPTTCDDIVGDKKLFRWHDMLDSIWEDVALIEFYKKEYPEPWLAVVGRQVSFLTEAEYKEMKG